MLATDVRSRGVAVTERKTTKNGDARWEAGVQDEPYLFMAGQVLQHVAGN